MSVLTVTELTRSVRATLEEGFREIWVEGEISNHRLQGASGHHYFTLKDEGAQLKCVFFKGQARFSPLALHDGLSLQVLGNLSVYEPRGEYQMVVKVVKGVGAGQLQARFEALKTRLAAEGLFDHARKRPLPAFPAHIALVTAPGGAAIRDMLQILERRAPWTRVFVYPVRVQGKGAEHEIAAAIAWLNKESGRSLPALDLIIAGRGGGSLEDLWCFNEEVTARAIAGSSLPVVSAVGHEIDFTIADFAADLRAPTPSAAVELVSPDGETLRQRFAAMNARLAHQVGQAVAHHDRMLGTISPERLLRECQRQWEQGEQRLDYLDEALREAVDERPANLRQRLSNIAHALEARQPTHLLELAEVRLPPLARALQERLEDHLDRWGRHLAATSRLLKSMAPEATLARGFSLTMDENGQLVTDAAQAPPGMGLRTKLARGEITSTVNVRI